MKRISFLIIPFSLSLGMMFGCNQSSVGSVTREVDSLKSKLKAAYVPGTGEIMNGIVQPHHYKLWLAGSHQNWALAEYERHQLLGGFKRIAKYHKGTPEADAVPMIYPEIDAIEKAIHNKNISDFKDHFILLTHTCNTCHQATHYEFNIIKVPNASSFDNQQF